MEVMTERIKAVEENSRLLEKRLVAAIQTIQSLRHDITLGRIERKRKNNESAETIVANILDDRELVVPPALAIHAARCRRTNRKTGCRNRVPDIVAKRWGLWKIQHESGYTVHQIARAWKCCRTTVENARNLGFIPLGAR